MNTQVQTVPVEVIDLSWLYQTTIDNIRVTVRATTDISGYVYYIQVEVDGEAVCTKYQDSQMLALTMADLLRDIYYNKLDEDLLWH